MRDTLRDVVDLVPNAETNAQTFLDDEWPRQIFERYSFEEAAFYFLNGSYAFGRTRMPETGNYGQLKTLRDLDGIPFKDFGSPTGLNERAFGIILPPGRSPYLLVAVPLQENEFTGLTPGTLVVAKRLDLNYVDDVAYRIQLCVTMYTTNNVSAWGPLFQSGLTKGSKFFKDPIQIDYFNTSWQDRNAMHNYIMDKPAKVSDEPNLLVGRKCWPSSSSLESDPTLSETTFKRSRLVGFNIYRDVYGNASNAIILRVDANRRISELGTAALQTALIVLLLVGVMFLILILCLLEFCVMFRMSRLSVQINRIRESDDLKDTLKRVTEYRRIFITDEIHYFAHAINKFFKQIFNNAAETDELILRVGKMREESIELVNSLPTPLAIFDPKGKISFANKIFEKLFYPLREMTKKPIYDIIPDINKDDINSNILENVETIAHGKFGTRIHVAVTTVPIMLGDVENRLIMLRDETEKYESLAQIDRDIKSQALLTELLLFEEVWEDPIRKDAFISFAKTKGFEANVEYLLETNEYLYLSHDKRKHFQKEILTKYLDPNAEKHIQVDPEALKVSHPRVTKFNGASDCYIALDKAVRSFMIQDCFEEYKSKEQEYIQQVLGQ